MVGSQEFDVEIWNELTFGSDFLDQGAYYQPARRGRPGARNRRDPLSYRRRAPRTREPYSENRDRERLRQPDALSRRLQQPARTDRRSTRHPYYGIKRFPQDAVFDGIAPLDALGQWSFDEQTSPQGQPVRRDRRAALPRILPRVHPHCDPDGDDDPRHLADHRGVCTARRHGRKPAPAGRRRRRSGH